MKGVFYIVSFLFLMLVACSDSDTDNEIPESNYNFVFVAELIPLDEDGDDNSYDVSQNVIQGVAAFENGWFTAQTSADKFLLINYLDQTGQSEFNIKLATVSHGQDLSLEQVSDNELILYTSSGIFDEVRGTGILSLRVILPEKVGGERDMSKTQISIDNRYNLNYTNATPSINEDKNKFAIRSNSTILIHYKESILNNDFSPLYRFELNKEQLIDNEGKNMWFQGIAMKNEIVFCLTGNGTVTSEKKIFSYDKNGLVLSKIEIKEGDFEQIIEGKFEPESLSFIENQLYFTIMTKRNGVDGNVKYMYKIIEE